MPSAIPPRQGLYDPAFEHDACGVAFVVDLHGRRTHRLVEQGIAGLLAQDVAHRPDLARIAALAQDRRRRIALALQVFRKGHRHDGDARQLRGQFLDRRGSGKDDLGDPLGRRHGYGFVDR